MYSVYLNYKTSNIWPISVAVVFYSDNDPYLLILKGHFQVYTSNFSQIIYLYYHTKCQI